MGQTQDRYLKYTSSYSSILQNVYSTVLAEPVSERIPVRILTGICLEEVLYDGRPWHFGFLDNLRNGFRVPSARRGADLRRCTPFRMGVILETFLAEPFASFAGLLLPFFALVVLKSTP